MSRPSRWRYGPLVQLADNLYVDWSTVSDAPCCAYTRAEVEAIAAYEVAEAEQRLAEARTLLARLDRNGHTMLDTRRSVRSFVDGNRAGPQDRSLSFGELVEWANSRLADPDGLGFAERVEADTARRRADIAKIEAGEPVQP